ncbi:50S ribosomal protein L1 [Candidatus Peregrinibacteria bacterium]|nr:50S ribosomal protein L1 [Candidatus Peregrinibacteria bacterium]
MKKKHGKKYNEALKLIEKESYGLDEAVELLKKTSITKFDSSCEVHFNLGIDPSQAEENIRTSVTLPHGTGKDIRIVAFVSDDKIKESKDAGAIEAGTEDLIEKIEKGWTDFDVAVAAPDQMKEIGKIAKILGQKRLMPSPKAGTITPDPAKTIQELKKGKVEVRIDKEGNLHNVFGKTSFENSKIKENFSALFKAVLDAKPTTVKGTYIKTLTLTTSMGPGIPVDTKKVISETK